ncbi:hypothetical protein [uncultured Rikenella sp.]|uniref:hypothetical protein n=1 Tax=uncultured Rikenella sp. TaxID=368003 RepID=UPI002620C4DA|nr:hypothetical protein [uncultured Rikenella sp.]
MIYKYKLSEQQNNPAVRKNALSPAPGFRGSASGALSYVGDYGYSWASTASGISGMYLHFYATELSPSHSANRAYGLQLRCLSE